MEVLKRDSRLETGEPSVLIDPELPPGKYRVTLVVSSARGSSDPAEIVLIVRSSGPLVPPGGLVVAPPGGTVLAPPTGLVVAPRAGPAVVPPTGPTPPIGPAVAPPSGLNTGAPVSVAPTVKPAVTIEAPVRIKPSALSPTPRAVAPRKPSQPAEKPQRDAAASPKPKAKRARQVGKPAPKSRAKPTKPKR